MYQNVLFDLDGTVTDSGPGIINSIRYALEKYHLPVPAEAVLRTFIGPPLKEQFMAVCGLNEAEGVRMVEAYREYYSEKGIFENRVYDGIPEVLKALNDNGVRILMATAKPEVYAKKIAEHFNFVQYFDFIGGACLDGRRTDKYEVIRYSLDACGITEPDHTVMIGDRFHDVAGAHKAGIPCIGVLYGYGTREELSTAGADRIAGQPADLVKLIMEK